MKLLFILTLLMQPADPVSTSHCDRIDDPDSRHHCRARATGKSIHCESIRNFDLRHYCRAETTRSQTWCSSIRDPGLRTLCRGMLDGCGSS